MIPPHYFLANSKRHSHETCTEMLEEKQNGLEDVNDKEYTSEEQNFT